MISVVKKDNGEGDVVQITAKLSKNEKSKDVVIPFSALDDLIDALKSLSESNNEAPKKSEKSKKSKKSNKTEKVAESAANENKDVKTPGPADTVLVTGLSESSTKDDLRAHFSQSGTVKRVVFNGKTRARVIFASEEEASHAATTLNATVLNGDMLSCSLRSSKSVKTAKAKKDKTVVERKPGPVDTVLVTGLSESSTKDDLRAHFSQSGTVKRIFFNGKTRARVIFASEEEASHAATTLNATVLNGDMLSCSLRSSKGEKVEKPADTDEAKVNSRRRKQDSQVERVENPRKVFVQLDGPFDKESYENLMAEFGTVKEMRSYARRKSVVAVVEYESEADATAAVDALSTRTINNSVVKIHRYAE